MKKITVFLYCLAFLFIGILAYIFWNEQQEQGSIQANIKKGIPNFPKDTVAKSDSCQWLWYSSVSLYKVGVSKNGKVTIGYGSRKWEKKLKDIPTKIIFADGDFNLNNSPELYLFGLTSHGYVLAAFELQPKKLQSFSLPPLMGTLQLDYQGNDSLYFEKNFLVRQFSTKSGKKACYYELMPNLQFELRFTKLL